MRILYVASEASPFFATGGLGDVMGALPSYIAKSDEIETVECIIPLYGDLPGSVSKKIKKVADLSFRYSWRDTGATVYSYTKGKTVYYFVENNYYFKREKMYGEYDDGERFAFFSMAVLEFLLKKKEVPDVIHANDWHTAPVVIYLKTLYSQSEALKNVKCVFTIHNIEFQGRFDPYILGNVFALGNEYLDVLSHDGSINLLKGALCFADVVTSVSENYANELEHDYYSFGLSGVIRSIRWKMHGILNGIDTDVFSPASDPFIYSRYSARTVRSGKMKNKAEFLREYGFSGDTEIPLIAVVSRLTGQKGTDLILHVAEEILDEKINLFVLGCGEREFEEAFSGIAERHENCKFVNCFDRALSHKVYAAADIFLMPSRREPCGLAQMISCSYGTIPIVRSTGGLFDSIIPYGENGANGFRFDNYNAHELLFTLKRALELYNGNKELWHKLRQSAMRSDFSWERSASRYIELYKGLVKEEDVKK